MSKEEGDIKKKKKKVGGLDPALSCKDPRKLHPGRWPRWKKIYTRQEGGLKHDEGVWAYKELH